MKRLAAALPLLCLVTPALAHPGHVAMEGIAAGAMHPLSGADHLLAMVAVGLWAGLNGGNKAWTWPATFVASMIAGGMLGMAHLALPGSEAVILASLLVLGVAVAGTFRPSAAVGSTLIALFGLAHGYAHGSEMPATAGGLSFALGFVIATASLHAAGLGVALAARRVALDGITRTAGVGIAGAGLAMLFGLV